MTSVQRTAKRWEKKVAEDLSLVWVVREDYGVSVPDVVEVQGDPPPRGYWELLQRHALGPLLGECTSRQHKDMPAYIVKALSRGVPEINRAIPKWLQRWVTQVNSYCPEMFPTLRFVAVNKKPGRGKGKGTCLFVVVDREQFMNVIGVEPGGVRWFNLVLLHYDDFVSVINDWRK